MSKPAEKVASRPPERRGRRERSDAVTGVDEFDSSTQKKLEEMAAAAAVPSASAVEPPSAPSLDLASGLLSGFKIGELKEMEGEEFDPSSSDPFAAVVEVAESKPAAKKAIAPPKLPGAEDGVAVKPREEAVAGDLVLEDLEKKDLGLEEDGPVASVARPAGSKFSDGRGGGRSSL